jgi:hypothetical protein
VYVSGAWAWAPGPRVARPAYAPALVAFFGGPGVAVGVARPTVGWVALGWGEPLIPWWGRPGFVGVPCWAGWGGPHVVNNMVVTHTTVVKATSVKVFRNTSVKQAVVAVPRDRFGGAPVARVRASHVDADRLAPMRGTIVRHPGEMTRDPDGPARRPTTQPAPARTAAPTPAITAPAPASRPTAQAAPAPTLQRPGAERPSAAPSAVAPRPAPAPRWRRDSAVRNQPTALPAPGRIAPGVTRPSAPAGTRLRTPQHAAPTR